MPTDLVWEKENRRCLVQVVRDLRRTEHGQYYWKSGIPKNPDIPKCLVKICDKVLLDEYYPRDDEFTLISNWLDDDSKTLVAEAFKIKEMLNIANLKNPENRVKEAVFLTRGAQEEAKT